MESSSVWRAAAVGSHKENALALWCVRSCRRDNISLIEQVHATNYPDFLKKSRSSDGQLPLHVACHCAESIVGVQVLLEHYPDAAKQKDKQGKLPLAWACQNDDLKGEDLLAVIELLVRYYPEAIDAEDNDGNKAIDLDMQGRMLKHMAKEMG